MNNTKLQIDFAAMCAAFNIRTAKPGERHYRHGWVCLPCPFCSGQAGNHLGFNPKANVFTCFRCGRHGKYETIGALLGVPKKEAYERAKKFSLNTWQVLQEAHDTQSNTYSRKQQDEKEEEFVLPGKSRIPTLHANYLRGRGFNPVHLVNDWNLRFVGSTGRYAYRIIIPITYRGQTVSFTSRDVTGQQQDRYLACPPAEALRHHKECVYGLDQSSYRTCVVVEGPFGVWRVGAGALCTFGTGWTHVQARLIAKRFTKSFLFFDPEEREAAARAERLSTFLASYREHKSFVIEATGAEGRDTGELDKKEVREIRRLLK